MTVLFPVLADQLTENLASLDDLDPSSDVVLMAEVREEATYVRHHKQKIAFLFSAMRHFAQRLRTKGINVDYVKLDDPHNTGSLTSEVERACRRHGAVRIVATEPGEWRVLGLMRNWGQSGIALELKEDRRFLASRRDFEAFAEGKLQYRMEFFYRDMRRKTGFLMEGDEPVGGRWNFDHDNRKSLPASLHPPDPPRFAPSSITRDVLELVGRAFPDHFGDLEPFSWAVTREGALQALDCFIEERLPDFGDYQDAMKTGEPFLYHAVISPYLNCGLLTAFEVCERAERAWREGLAPLNAVEGFIRQILGWREYMRGIYWLKMPDYARTNHFDADRKLPGFYWNADTKMNCLKQVVTETRRHAYAHHIQRLMVTGNFALLAGLDPREVEEWYLLVYADAYEWVELPNVHGMSLFADGGLLASKPYAASGAYIDRMSDYCKDCAYDPKRKEGGKACPFNYLYWDFLIRNQPHLGRNQRLAMPYRTLAKMKPERRAEIREDAARFLAELDAAPSGY